MFKRKPLLLVVLVLLAAATWVPLHFWSNPALWGAKLVKIQLTRGPFTVFEFPSRKPPPQAILIFASGDGGWGRLEQSICRTFQKQGYTVIGIDSTAYAASDYDLPVLQADYGTIALNILAHYGKPSPPLIVGGYSMGAAQAIAVAGGPHPPPGLVGLLVMDPLSRGRYGLRTEDQMNVLPKGPGTFSMASFSKTMPSLRVVQWHAADDGIDSHTWLDSLTAPHRFFTFPDTGHRYRNNRPAFIRQLVDSAQWVTAPKATAAAPEKATP